MYERLKIPKFASVMLPFVLLTLFPGRNCIVEAAEPEFLGRTRQQWVDQIESSDRRSRVHAAWALSQFAAQQAGSSDATVWLNELFLLAESDSSSIRYWGVVGIQRFMLASKEAATFREPAINLLSDVLNDTAPTPRIAAAETLALIGQPQRALPVLTRALEDPQESTRIAAATALEKIGPAALPARAALQAAAENDSSEYVKRITSRAIGSLPAEQPK